MIENDKFDNRKDALTPPVEIAGAEVNRISKDERSEKLSREITNHVAQGFRVESQTSTHAILVKGQKINHILHLLLTILTAGFWAIVWIILAIMKRQKRLSITVDEWGNTQSSLL